MPTVAVAVALGLVGERPAGVADLVVNASLERRLSSIWSVDAQVNHQGATFAEVRNTIAAPSVTTLNLGARARLTPAGQPVQVRLLATNVLDERGWTT